MNLIYIAIMAPVAFIAIWMVFVVPAERKHHERKLEALRKEIEKRESSKQQDKTYGAPDAGDATSNDDATNKA